MFVVMIDGEYLRIRAKKLGVRVNLPDFVRELITELGLNPNDLLRVYYYTAPPLPNPVSDKDLYDGWVKFVDWLRYQGFEVRVGKLKLITTEAGEQKFIQKMTDILLAIDGIELSSNSKIDTIILITGDDDYVPVVRKIKDNATKLVLGYFEDNVGKNLLKEADKRIDITQIVLTKAKL